MRVIAGKSRGTSLYSLEGNHTRPTTDRVKEAMFSILNFNIPGAVVLDLFAGSGALGIEAISRGAEKCYFAENSVQAAEVVKKNIEKTNSGANALLKVVEDEMKNNGIKVSLIHLGEPKEQWFESYAFYPKHGYKEFEPRYMKKEL